MDFKTLQKDMIAAMKAHDKPRKEAISALVSAAKKIAIDEGTRDNISDDQVNRAVMKELHSAEEQLATCPDERKDLKAEYQFRFDVIKEYAPKMMSADEIEQKLKTADHEGRHAGSEGQGRRQADQPGRLEAARVSTN